MTPQPLAAALKKSTVRALVLFSSLSFFFFVPSHLDVRSVLIVYQLVFFTHASFLPPLSPLNPPLPLAPPFFFPSTGIKQLHMVAEMARTQGGTVTHSKFSESLRSYGL